jgi:hypothetical protein
MDASRLSRFSHQIPYQIGGEVVKKTVEQLKDWRNKTLTKQFKVQANYLFTNKQAEDIIRVYPLSVKELAKSVPGFPADGERCKKYGEAIVTFLHKSSAFS